MINQGRSPIVEPGLDELIREMVEQERLRATLEATEAVEDSEAALICVGSPSNGNGSQDLRYVRRVCEEIGAALRARQGYYVVALRSTVLPGSTEEVAIPILESTSGKRVGDGLGVCFNPEFIREGTSLEDFYHPPFTIIGEGDMTAGQTLAGLYQGLGGPLVKTSIREAEMIKYICNAFHALKVVFGNEIGNLCKRQGIDGQRVMEVFCLDTKLNVSSSYLRPGFAFGGSCLGKDLRAILYQAKTLDLHLPLLSSVLPSNEHQVRLAVELIRETGKKRVGLLGLAFKTNTDDLRESPLVALAETLLGKGYQVRILDRRVSLAGLYGANKSYIEQEIPHISSLMCDSVEELVENSEVLVIADRSEDARAALPMAEAKHVIVDLVGVRDSLPSHLLASYRGICW
jgi:GDP-mannose 6-dehydrogenase